MKLGRGQGCEPIKIRLRAPLPRGTDGDFGMAEAKQQVRGPRASCDDGRSSVYNASGSGGS